MILGCETIKRVGTQDWWQFADIRTFLFITKEDCVKRVIAYWGKESKRGKQTWKQTQIQIKVRILNRKSDLHQMNERTIDQTRMHLTIVIHCYHLEGINNKSCEIEWCVLIQWAIRIRCVVANRYQYYGLKFEPPNIAIILVHHIISLTRGNEEQCPSHVNAEMLINYWFEVEIGLWWVNTKADQTSSMFKAELWINVCISSSNMSTFDRTQDKWTMSNYAMSNINHRRGGHPKEEEEEKLV